MPTRRRAPVGAVGWTPTLAIVRPGRACWTCKSGWAACPATCCCPPCKPPASSSAGACWPWPCWPGGGAALGLYSTPPWRVLTAGLRTATGERRTVTLPDGGMLYLNTGSAVDVDYGSERRLLRLYQGEVLVQTAPDNAGRRPFEVLTSDGSVRALGTRFSVRRDEDATRVAVFQDAVLLQPADPGAAPLRLSAGQQSLLTARAAAAPQPVLPSQAAWVDGRLVAIDQPLGDFIAELARYRSGSLTCDPAVAHLRLSGAFRLADTDAVLENVAASLPVALRTRTRYWVRVVPR